MKKFISFIFALLSVFLFAVAIGMSLQIDPVTSLSVAVLVSAVFAFTVQNTHDLSFVTVCGAFNGNIEYDCEKPIQAGLQARIVIINKQDIVGVTSGTGNVISDITLATGKVAHVISGRRNTIVATSSLIPAQELYDHAITAMGFDISALTKEILEGAKSGRFVIIAENIHKGTGDKDAFEVYGLNAGLVLMENNRDTSSVETQGAFALRFANDEVSKETQLPKTLFDTDYTTTKALVDALLVP